MTLLKSQRNQFFEILLSAGINPVQVTAEHGEEYYRIDLMVGDVNCLFCVFLDRVDSFRIGMNPGYDYGMNDFTVEKWDDVIDCFTAWADQICDELKAPDL